MSADRETCTRLSLGFKVPVDEKAGKLPVTMINQRALNFGAVGIKVEMKILKVPGIENSFFFLSCLHDC